MSDCHTCGNRDHLCQECRHEALEARHGTPRSNIQTDADGVFCWVQDLSEVWHASMYFEGSRHVGACGTILECPVADVRDDARRIAEIETCDECSDALEADVEEETVPDGGDFAPASELRADGSGYRCDWCGKGHYDPGQALKCCSDEFDRRVNSRPMTDGGHGHSVDGTEQETEPDEDAIKAVTEIGVTNECDNCGSENISGQVHCAVCGGLVNDV